LVDCGRSVTQRALEADLDLSSLLAVLITHHHSDHVSDLASLAITRFIGGASTPLRVIAPLGPSSRFAVSCLNGYEDQAFYSQRKAGSSERPALDVEPFASSPEPVVVLSDGHWLVQSAAVDHHPMEAAVGYRIQIDDAAVAVSGDTVVCDGVRNLARHADILVHEALRSDQVSAAALAWNASARSVGALAESARVGHLVLTHLLPPPANEADERAFVDEARSGGYEGPILTPSDLDRLRPGGSA
jgi:ribonuclease Z